MGLQRFILRNLETLLDDWTRFAATRSQCRAPGLSARQLREHGEDILRAVAADMVNAQTPQQQFEKSRGLAIRACAEHTGAEQHAIARYGDGFDINDLIAEYRALRATVLRQWAHDRSPRDAAPCGEIIRFNESIDQAVAESVAVIVDLGMPGMEGTEVARRLRALPSGPHMTLVALTGYGQAADRLRSAAAGFDHHLAKPVDLASFESIPAAVPSAS